MAEQVKQEQPGVVTQQPKALKGMPTMIEARAKTGSEEWSHEIFDCFQGEDSLCMFSATLAFKNKLTPLGLKTCFCPCFTYGKTMHRIREPSMATYERVNNDCLMWVG